MIRDSVARRKELIYGRLRDGKGGVCAIGGFWDDNPKIALHSSLIDEVAAYNDSIPPTCTPKSRQRRVLRWLRWKLRVLEVASKK
jgi:hypothetical protein